MNSSPQQRQAANAERIAVYLPVTERVTRAFLEEAALPDLPIERAALITLLMFHGRGVASVTQVCQALSEAEALFLEQPEAETGDALREMRRNHGQPLIDNLAEQLLEAGLILASDEAMEQAFWRGPSGRFHPIFQERCRTTVTPFAFHADRVGLDVAARFNLSSGLTDADDARAPARTTVRVRSTSDQARIFTIVAASPEEHIDLQGYAGTGKTHLLTTLHESLGGLTHVLLRADDREAFKVRTGLRDVVSVTLGQIATRMAADQFRGQLGSRYVPPRIGPGHLSLAQQADEIGIDRGGVGGKPPAVVMGDLIRAIKSFAWRPDQAISPSLFVTKGYAAADLPVLAALAERLWSAMFEPTQANAPRPFAIWEYHLAKWLALRGAKIPPMGYLVIDEGHDLSAPWQQLLGEYSGGMLMMGDPYQRLEGAQHSTERMKRATMAQSVRTGEQAIPAIQAVLRKHSESLVDDDIRGTKEHETRVRPYANRDEVRDAGLRVYGSIWQLFADAMRLRDSGKPFAMLEPSFGALQKVLTDALALWKFGDRPRRRELAGITTRDALEEHLAAVGQDKVRRLFAQGFGFEEASQLAKSIAEANAVAKQGGQDRVTLGLLEHTRNIESSVVFMSPCCFTTDSSGPYVGNQDRKVRAIYLSMSRVRDELWWPHNAMEALGI
ncbi:hypothetical protein RHOFW510R12_01035 [Rhodanobacter sp. FW510-R12]|uniref:hypothetical protein n=1 Tax=Rhodanobacter thiooxydans TaxID=416169 RepID=UPI000922C3E4|nr:hypothetical protein [Rhodanobacter thiooxydans]UJJ56677.1 hypothetical protein LRK53_18890 [Rhodanobacter thiooxydans]